MSVWRVRASALRRDCLTLLHIFSMGLRSGLQAGRKRAVAPACSVRARVKGIFVRQEIVHDDDVSGAQGRAQDVADVGAEDFRIGGSFDGHASGGAIQADRGDHARGVPVAVGAARMDSLASRGAAAQAGHVGFRPRFVKEDEPRGIEAALLPTPRPTRFGDVAPILLAGAQRLFLYVRPSDPSA